MVLTPKGASTNISLSISKLSPPVLQAPLYLRTSSCYTNVLLLLLFLSFFACVRGTCPSYFRGVYRLHCTAEVRRLHSAYWSQWTVKASRRLIGYVPATKTKLGKRSSELLRRKHETLYCYIFVHQPRTVPDWTPNPPVHVRLHMTFYPWELLRSEL